MRDDYRENLSDLFAKFFDTKEAEGIIDDLHAADQVLRDHPAPEPDTRLLAQIKVDLAGALLSKQARQSKYRIHKRIAAVAAVAMSAGLFVTLFSTGPEPGGLATASIIPTAIWESSNIAVDDEDLATLTAEIEQLEEEVMTLESTDDTSDSLRALDELEMELIVVRNDFWKE